MKSRRPKTVPVSSAIVDSGSSRLAIDEIVCPGCGVPLDIHQPDESMPERLLGVCPECHDWAKVKVDDSAGLVELTPIALPSD